MALTVGALSAAAGSKARGVVRADLGSGAADIPVTLVNGAASGPRVVITGGVHGGEFVGIEAAHRLAADLEPAKVRGQVVICPVANPPAAYLGRLGASPLDGVNINRVFPGDTDGGATERLAAWLFENLITGADAYADLHSGGIDEVLVDFVGYRLTGDAGLDTKTRAMAHAVGYEHIIYGTDADGGNSHAAAARQGVPSILIETGQLGERGPAVVRTLLNGLYRLLEHLGVLDTSTRTGASTEEWVWAGSVTSPATGLWYPDFDCGAQVTAGQTLGLIVDPAEGREHKITAPATGTVFYGMSGLTVAPGTELAAIAKAAGPGRTAESLQTPSEPEVLS